MTSFPHRLLHDPNVRVTVIPADFERRVRAALLDNFTGNLQLNVHRGKIVGIRVEEVVNLASTKI